MKDVIQIRKKRFGAFLLALSILLCQIAPVTSHAASYGVSESELSGRVLQPGDTLNCASDTEGTYAVVYMDAQWNTTHTDTASYNAGYAVLDPAGANVTVPDGATFAGWDVESVYQSGNETSVTLTARISYPILYSGTEGATHNNPAFYVYGEGIATLAPASKAGFTFEGWFLDAEHTLPVTEISYDQSGSITLHAYFTENPSHLITYDLDGGINGNNPSSYIEGIGTTLAPASKAGYTFAGWYSDAGFITPVTAIDGTWAEDVTLYAKFEVAQYTITFNTAGGSTIAPITAHFGATITAPANPTREGYSFTGWDAEIPATMPAENLTITAKWTANQYTITFDTAGGSAISPIIADFGATITAPADPTREGYSFAGWDAEIPATMPAENLTITARWTANSYTITFDTTGGSAVSPIAADFGAAITAPADPTKEGYTFAGWDAEIPATMPAENLTITAMWTVNQYTITFDTAGGSAIAPITADFGATVTAPADPSKEGYTFAGWGTEIPATMPAENLTISAKWVVNAYTITFDTDGGSAIAPITADFGATITAPADPSKEGYSFAGWDVAIPATMPAENLTITAKWAVNQYTISFDTAGGSAVAPITANFGAAITAPADPTKEGYTFAGWDAEIPATMPAENLTITAKWTVNAYTITFDTAGGSAIAPITADFGATITAPADPSKEGYTFAGWGTEIPATMPAENLTITAMWTVNQYTITFDTAGGSAIAPITADFGATITAPADPTKEGYTFAGWDVAIPATMPAENLTITAKWTANQYTITFDTAGGSAIAPITADFGATVTTPADPTREGYTFAGWGTEIPASMPAENLTITAKWVVNAYTITFDTDGGSAIAPITTDFGATITAPADPSKEGYSFTGWDAEIPATMPAENLTITANWTVNAYTITFDTAGGSAVASITADFGATITVPADPTREGYTFAGWDTEIPATMPAENLTISAKWVVNAYTITFDTAGGSAIAPITADFGAAITAPADPTRVGYTFAGWGTEIPTTMPAENLTISAKWVVNAYTITFDTDGGSAIAPITAGFGATITVPANPTRVGYTFAGWDVEIPAAMPAENLTVTANWTVNAYTITFDTDGGSAIAPITADFGATITAPADPSKEGYTFAGWDTEIPASMPAENLTITAKWTENSPLVIEAGTHQLTAGVPYILGNVTKISGDPSTYVSGSIFYVPVSGSYTFS